VLGWEGEALTDRIVLQVASTGHRAEPLACIAFVDVRTLRQFCARRWSLLGQVLEEAKTVTDRDLYPASSGYATPPDQPGSWH
jgi:hypothetical protein